MISFPYIDDGFSLPPYSMRINCFRCRSPFRAVRAGQRLCCHCHDFDPTVDGTAQGAVGADPSTLFQRTI